MVYFGNFTLETLLWKLSLSVCKNIDIFMAKELLLPYWSWGNFGDFGDYLEL